MKTIKGIWPHILQFFVLIFFSFVSSAQVHADFSATPVSGCPPVIVNFKDISTGNPSYWKWDLGNGTISYLQNPIATYFNPGSYNIKLIVKGANGADSVARSKYIVVNALPVPAFSVSDSSGCFPLKIRFSDNSLAGSGTVTNWQWDFGDGSLSNEKNPEHTYTHSGSFTVILTITNSNGCSRTITKPSFIKLINGVKADFSYTTMPGCSSPASVNFQNTSSGTGTIKYTWDFGDGNTSASNNPANNYLKEGVYTVKLIASNNFGCTDTAVKTNAINIVFSKANFSKPDTVCAGNPFVLNNISGPGAISASKWSFGDGKTSDSLNPSQTYSRPGIYQVKLVTGFGNCSDSIVKSITVSPKPVVSFTSVNNTGCRAPLNVSFSNTSQNAVSFLWNFGDSSTSTLQNPVHSYKKVGNYTVTLIVKNASGCSETLIKENFVKITPPKIAGINNLQVAGCIPSIFTPVAIMHDSTAVSSYLWNFGDSTISRDSMPSHTYTKPGKYTVKLTITTTLGCTDTLTLPDAIKVGSKPVAQFSADPLDICSFTQVNFKDLSRNAVINDWSWSFGDGGSSVSQNPIHLYGDTGYMNVTLVVFNYGCSDTLTKFNYIHVRPPIAKFDTAFSCNDPLKRNFINNSIGATTWSWSFGDGSTSTKEQVSHTYSTPGTYNVVLKVTNGDCENITNKEVVVIKENGKLQISDSITCRDQLVTFNIANINSSNISSYNWFFNGLTQPGAVTANNPAVTQYNTTGVKSGAVVMTNLLQCPDTLYANVPIKTYGPTVSFGSSTTATCLGNIVNFSDSSKTDGIHPINNYTWNFGEEPSKIYTSSPVSHTYSKTGTYDVKLVVTDSYGCKDSITKPAFISITKPKAAFSASDTVICPASPITFTNYSEAVQPAYFWNFGDGALSGEVSPIHSFTRPGIYTVRMLVVDKNGCRDSASVVVKIFAASAAFAMSDSFSTCPPLIVNLANKSSNFIQYNWDFGDGGNSQLLNPAHIYTYPGNYTVKLLVKNNGGCSDSTIRKIVVKGPTGIFDYTPKTTCNPGKIDFALQSQNAVNYVWDYNDGATIISTQTSQRHTYTDAGIYVPKVILEDAVGCKVALTGLDTIKVNGIETHILSDAKVLCDSGYVSFSDSTLSNDVVSSFLWNFGDGTTSTSQTPVHKYAANGLYTISLVARSSFGCTDTTVENKSIKIVSSPIVKILGDSSACAPANLIYQGVFVRNDTSAVKWEWDFGNGSTSILQKPAAQNFANAGTFAVTVKVTNSDGCSDVFTKSTIIHPKPVVEAGDDKSICRYNNITLHATGADSYTWSANPSLSCTNCASPVAKPDSTITYHVLGKTIFGCTDEDSMTVKVKQPFKMTVGSGDTLCKGESFNLKATGAEMYEWAPSLYLDNATIGTPKSKPASSVTYQVTGKDSIGCFVQKGSVEIKVYPIPEIEITNGHNITLQAGKSVELSTKSSADVTKWKWYPSQYLSCGSCATAKASPNDNITYQVTASNPGNCEARDQVTINVVCNNANVFMPNTFSPNHDGVNDVFYPRGSGIFTIKSFKVFSRWGQILFSKDDITANNPAYGWDGTANGVPLPDDVYVYVLEVVCSNNTILPLKGNITLLR